MIVIGEIVKAQGVKGELKIMPMTDNEERFLKLKSVVIDGETRDVTSARVSPNGVFITINGVDDRNAAELLRGKKISVTRENAVKPPKGRYFIVDLIGIDVVIEGDTVGKLVDIAQSGSADVYTVKGKDGKSVVFPALKDAIISVDIENRKMTLDKKRFEEIALYED
ncbi:MAG: ribosome maturation factor RimM [Clostridia bacterium]|nr:ribosome maturation factor RimM [Clostridia bacterium]